MNKSLKIAKMNIEDMAKSILIFYGFLMAYLLFITRWTIGSDEVGVACVELFTVFFIAFQGISRFKRKFYFAQGNNISRKAFIKGMAISILPISMTMAIIDLFINRAINVFIKMPSLYDAIWGEYQARNLSSGWIQDNSIGTMLNTIVFLFAIYCMFYILGLFMNMISYNKGEWGQVIFLAIIVVVIKILRAIMEKYNIMPYEISNKIKTFFNISDSNIILEVGSCLLIFIALYYVVTIVIKKATVK